MPTRMTISFTPEEGKILQAMAEADCRSPKDQIRWLLCQEARQRGLWPSRNQCIRGALAEVSHADT